MCPVLFLPKLVKKLIPKLFMLPIVLLCCLVFIEIAAITLLSTVLLLARRERAVAPFIGVFIIRVTLPIGVTTVRRITI